MGIQTALTTNRLLIEPLSLDDNDFIFELINTEGWIRFIGNRNINSATQAIDYIQKIIDNQNINYWVVKLKEENIKIGIITFIKRDYLDHYDIGFAFLPNYTHNGFAYEASVKILDFVSALPGQNSILATTVPENISSIKLLKKLGMNFEKEIERDNIILHVYGMLMNKV